eukprot:TRINITY_DN4003_c0_g1_i2.p2 TRINITY_DN4003_c0_g1~~TRINITY_DN4003_c0_g1_i2.p2  ORF type:complete len:170 (-),score=46.52 TRINITY_DN4003_c0_g1_i2:98-607(-)
MRKPMLSQNSSSSLTSLSDDEKSEEILESKSTSRIAKSRLRRRIQQKKEEEEERKEMDDYEEGEPDQDYDPIIPVYQFAALIFAVSFMISLVMHFVFILFEDFPVLVTVFGVSVGVSLLILMCVVPLWFERANLLILSFGLPALFVYGIGYFMQTYDYETERETENGCE